MIKGIGGLIILAIILVGCYSQKSTVRLAVEYSAKQLPQLGAVMRSEGRIAIQGDFILFQSKLHGKWYTTISMKTKTLVVKDDVIYTWKHNSVSYRINLRKKKMTVLNLKSGNTEEIYYLK